MSKLAAYTGLMVVIPLAIFYAFNSYYRNLTYAGIASAISANLVLIAFIFSAFSEEDD